MFALQDKTKVESQVRAEKRPKRPKRQKGFELEISSSEDEQPAESDARHGLKQSKSKQQSRKQPKLVAKPLAPLD